MAQPWTRWHCHQVPPAPGTEQDELGHQHLVLCHPSPHSQRLSQPKFPWDFPLWCLQLPPACWEPQRGGQTSPKPAQNQGGEDGQLQIRTKFLILAPEGDRDTLGIAGKQWNSLRFWGINGSSMEQPQFFGNKRCRGCCPSPCVTPAPRGSGQGGFPSVAAEQSQAPFLLPIRAVTAPGPLRSPRDTAQGRGGHREGVGGTKALITPKAPPLGAPCELQISWR